MALRINPIIKNCATVFEDRESIRLGGSIKDMLLLVSLVSMSINHLLTVSKDIFVYKI